MEKRDKQGERTTSKNGEIVKQQEAERCRDEDTGWERWVKFIMRGMLIKIKMSSTDWNPCVNKTQEKQV